MAKVEIIGIKELLDKFKKLSADIDGKPAQRVVAAAAGFVRNKAKENAKSAGLVRSGAFLKNIVIKRERDAPRGTMQYNVGVRTGGGLTKKAKANFRLVVNRKGRIVRRAVDDPWYWIFLEFGTVKYAARRPLTRALEGSVAEAIAVMEKQVEKEIMRAAGK